MVMCVEVVGRIVTGCLRKKMRREKGRRTWGLYCDC
jgi:hypothetical protein